MPIGKPFDPMKNKRPVPITQQQSVALRGMLAIAEAGAFVACLVWLATSFR